MALGLVQLHTAHDIEVGQAAVGFDKAGVGRDGRLVIFFGQEQTLLVARIQPEVVILVRQLVVETSLAGGKVNGCVILGQRLVGVTLRQVDVAKIYMGNGIVWIFLQRLRQQFLLASEAQKKEFAENPDRYVPRFLGCDPVVVWDSDRAVPGETTWAAFYDEELYLFSSAQNRSRFRKDPDKYTKTRVVLNVQDIQTLVR